MHMNHPRYFGLFNPAANFPAQCADRIAGAFNPQLASSGSSPAPVEIEAHVIRAIARRAGSSARSRLTLKLEQPLEQRLDRGNRAEIVRRDVCCGMLRSNSPSTASIRFTILMELIPSSLRRASTGSDCPSLLSRICPTSARRRARNTGAEADFAAASFMGYANDTGSSGVPSFALGDKGEPVAVDGHCRRLPGVLECRREGRERKTLQELRRALRQRLAFESFRQLRRLGGQITDRQRRVVRLRASKVAADIAPVFLQERGALVLRMPLEEEQEAATLADKGIRTTRGGPTENRVTRIAQRLQRQLVPARVWHEEWRAHPLQ